MAEIDTRRVVGPRTGGDDEMVCRDLIRRIGTRRDLQGMRIDKGGLTHQHGHPIAIVEALAHLHLPLDDLVGRGQQLRKPEVDLCCNITQQRVGAHIR